MEIGQDASSFWSQTPATYAATMRGARRRIQREAENGIATAHATASFSRIDKLKALDQYLIRQTGTKRQTGEEMLEAMRAIAAMGGKMTIKQRGG